MMRHSPKAQGAYNEEQNCEENVQIYNIMEKKSINQVVAFKRRHKPIKTNKQKQKEKKKKRKEMVLTGEMYWRVKTRSHGCKVL